LHHAQTAGLGADLLAALPSWRTADLFDEEQRLVIEYTEAVVTGDVPAKLFSDIVQQYGEKGAIEFTTLIAFWSAWAMIINAARPEFVFAS
jgi:alkylhydroperoxidase family enzyme